MLFIFLVFCVVFLVGYVLFIFLVFCVVFLVGYVLFIFLVFCVVFFVCLFSFCAMCPVLPLSLDCPFFIDPSVFSSA